jgi:hypothetical protein
MLKRPVHTDLGRLKTSSRREQKGHIGMRFRWRKRNKKK